MSWLLMYVKLALKVVIYHWVEGEESWDHTFSSIYDVEKDSIKTNVGSD